MKTLKRVVQRNIEATGTVAQQKARTAELARIQNPLKRAGLLVLNSVVARNPERAAELFKLDYQPRNMRHLANGNQSAVYQVGGDVIKINIPSITMATDERMAFVKTETDRHALLVEHLGLMALPHKMFIGRHPILRTETAVQISQPYVKGFDPELFTEARVEINAKHVEQLERSRPHALANLSAMAARSLQLYENTGLLADTNGARNLILLKDESCMLIDATPVGPEHGDVQSVIIAQTQQLAAL